jgi:hypothetical protein
MVALFTRFMLLPTAARHARFFLQATMFSPGVHVADNNNAQGFPADGSVGHGVHTLTIPASSYGRITPFV